MQTGYSLIAPAGGCVALPALLRMLELLLLGMALLEPGLFGIVLLDPVLGMVLPRLALFGPVLFGEPGVCAPG